VIFAGARSDAASAGAAGDVFALPSLHEGIPVALLEAMARGCPPVVTDGGGMPEVVRDGQDGLVVRAGVAAELAEALIRVLTDEPLRRRLATGAAERAAAFDIRPAVARMEAVYGGLLA
jgi:glycosyltransferase involved in cell wall biosynthesis